MFFCCAACTKAPSGNPVRSETSRPVRTETSSSARRSNEPSKAPIIGLGLATTASATALAPLTPSTPFTAKEATDPSVLAVHEADAASGAPRERGQKDDENPTKGLKKKARRRGSDDQKCGLKKRGSIQAMDEYLQKGRGAEPSVDASAPKRAAPGRSSVSVTAANAAIGMTVVRGPKWKRDDEDGGPGNLGQVFAVDGEAQTLMVRWEATRAVHDHYGLDGELAVFEHPDPPVPSVAGGHSSAPVGAFNRDWRRRNSQAFFSDALQTIIIYDWDDTLFPTTYVRDDMNLHWRTPLMEQKGLQRSELLVARGKLAAAQKNVLTLLADSLRLGKVVILTLARSPWVEESCKNFFPDVGEFIQNFKIPIVYAQEGQQIDYNKLAMSSDADVERHWAGVKGKAIARTIDSFYSQYQGQSWKNVLSVGDSDFERLGTMQATAEYLSKLGAMTGTRSDSKTPRSGSKTPTNAMRALNPFRAFSSKGRVGEKATLEADVDGHVIKVRTKTFKMIDQPECDELTTQVAMITKWIGLMVKLDEGFDVNLNELGNPAVLVKIERTLRGQPNP